MITVEHIFVHLGGQPILQDFSLQIERGEKVTLGGESGSGKSTLLKTLIGMHRPERGNIVVGGKPFVPENLREIRSQTFYLPQDIVPQGDETVQEYLEMPYGFQVNSGARMSAEKLDFFLAALRLKPELLTHPLQELSGGERKRVGLLRGLLLDRPIIFADEPTAGVDASNRDVIAEMLFQNPEVTVLAITHDEEVMGMADRQIFLPGQGTSAFREEV